MSQAKLVDITMPSLGADMTEGMLVKWLVKEGDQVNNGDIIAELETHKGAIDMEVYQSGVITKILVQPIVTVPVGTVLARLQPEVTITEPEQPIPPDVEQPSEIQSIATPVKATPVKVTSILDEPSIPEPTEVEQAVIKSAVTASPIVRRLAAEQQLDLSEIHGSGPQGAILLKDLPRQIPKPATGMRTAIAAAMKKSKTEIPHFYLSQDVDISSAQRWLCKINAEKPPEQRLLLIALLLKAVAKVLAKFPAVNGYYIDNQLQPAEVIHIGNVISLRQGGMVVPAIHDVDKLSLQDLMWAVRDITGRSRSGHLRSSELSDATITVTNMGDRGADSVYGIIYPPQVAIIGFGRSRQTALVKDNSLTIGDRMIVCLSADHRAVDGMLAAKFLNALSAQLQKPECL